MQMRVQGERELQHPAAHNVCEWSPSVLNTNKPSLHVLAPMQMAVQIVLKLPSQCEKQTETLQIAIRGSLSAYTFLGCSLQSRITFLCAGDLMCISKL